MPELPVPARMFILSEPPEPRGPVGSHLIATACRAAPRHRLRPAETQRARRAARESDLLAALAARSVPILLRLSRSADRAVGLRSNYSGRTVAAPLVRPPGRVGGADEQRPALPRA